MTTSPIEEIINFAIDKEREAIAFYADEERKHEKLLMNLTPKKLQFVRDTNQPDLKLSNYLVETPFSKDSTYQELLIIAMKREEKSHAMYSDLEQRASDDATRKLFTLLKGEELKHKTRLEKEYEEIVLWEG